MTLNEKGEGKPCPKTFRKKPGPQMRDRLRSQRSTQMKSECRHSRGSGDNFEKKTQIDTATD